MLRPISASPWRTAIALLSLLFTWILSGCAGSASADRGDGSAVAWDHSPPPLGAVTRVFEGTEEIELPQLIDSLATVDVVFVGETHVDDVTHRVEHAILKGLIDAANGRVVLAMEMFTRADQPALDRYLSGEIDESL